MRLPAFCVCALIPFLFASASAAPVVQSVNGSLQDRQQFTISGSGFGTKSPAEPWLWDDFEGGAIGQVVRGPHWSTYADYGGQLPAYSSDHARVPGHIASKQGPYGNTTLEAVGYPYGCDGGEMYVTGWFYGTQTGASRSMKFIQLNDGNWGYPQYRTGGDCNYYWSEVYNCSGNHVMNPAGIGSQPFTGTWDRWEWRARFGSNGLWETYRDLALKASGSGNFSSGCCVVSAYISSYYGVGSPCPPGSNGWWYWDEIYIDNTIARVELGDSPNWSSCNRREIQIPVAWNSSSITVQCNPGAFSSGSTAYLYVMDRNGAVNQNGLAVTIGGSGPSDNPPTIAIQDPTTGDNYATTDSLVVLAGTASDDLGVVSVSWSNDQTSGSGQAVNQSGDWSNWSTGDILLSAGTNSLTVRATDTTGHVATDHLTVDYDPGPPSEPGKPERF
jgi:hypothetical protein